MGTLETLLPCITAAALGPIAIGTVWFSRFRYPPESIPLNLEDTIANTRPVKIEPGTHDVTPEGSNTKYFLDVEQRGDDTEGVLITTMPGGSTPAIQHINADHPTLAIKQVDKNGTKIKIFGIVVYTNNGSSAQDE